MATLPQFRQRQLARRTGSDITRLASQFNVGIGALTEEYQRAFGMYQAGVEEKMAPFQVALSKYQTQDMPAYEAAKAEYKKQLDAYNEQLKALEADPFVPKTERVYVGRTWYGKKKYENIEYNEPKPIPKFEAKQPEMPVAPQAPEIGQFDEAPFAARRQQLQTELQRELGERKASRLGAVSRRAARPMLQGS